MNAKIALFALAALCAASAAQAAPSRLEITDLEKQLVSMTEEVLARDLATCFSVLDDSQEQLAELTKLMKATQELLLSIRDQLAKCKAPGAAPEDVKKCEAGVAADTREDVNAALANNLKWKDAAQENINRLMQCMAAA